MAKKPAASQPEYEQHPIAIKLMPGGMTEEEFDALCLDIKARGVIFPGTLYEGKVLDGWHRYRAARKMGVSLQFVTYEGSDPAGYIAACNILRRKLGSLQRALVGAKMHLHHGVTQDEVCKRLGISKTPLSLVLKAIDGGNARILRRIEEDSDYSRGMLREELEEAGLLAAKLPKEEQAPPPPPSAWSGASSVFNPAALQTPLTALRAAVGAPEPEPEEEGPDTELPEDEEEDLIGDDKPLPTVGKKPNHPERKPRESAAEALKQAFRELMYDEQVTFVQMVWPDLRPIAEELGMPGFGGSPAASAKLKAVG